MTDSSFWCPALKLKVRENLYKPEANKSYDRKMSAKMKVALSLCFLSFLVVSSSAFLYPWHASCKIDWYEMFYTFSLSFVGCLLTCLSKTDHTSYVRCQTFTSCSFYKM